MKKIEAIIKPFKLEEVKEALAGVGVEGMTVSEVRGISDMARSSFSELSPEPMVRIEVGVNDDFVERAVAAIEASGGDRGRIFTWPLAEVVRIRTGETGPEAI